MTCANTNLPSLIGPSRGLQTGRQDGPGRKSGRGRYRHHGEMTLPQYLSSTYCENAIQRWDTTDIKYEKFRIFGLEENRAFIVKNLRSSFDQVEPLPLGRRHSREGGNPGQRAARDH